MALLERTGDRDSAVHIDFEHVLAGTHELRHLRFSCQDEEHIGVFRMMPLCNWRFSTSEPVDAK
jgi:hypothetical protein